jgi:hypothetical protein
MRRLSVNRLGAGQKSGQNIPKNRCRTTIAERMVETPMELPFIGDQVVCLSHDQASRQRAEEGGARERSAPTPSFSPRKCRAPSWFWEMVSFGLTEARRGFRRSSGAAEGIARVRHHVAALTGSVDCRRMAQFLASQDSLMRLACPPARDSRSLANLSGLGNAA